MGDLPKTICLLQGILDVLPTLIYDKWVNVAINGIKYKEYWEGHGEGEFHFLGEISTLEPSFCFVCIT